MWIQSCSGVRRHRPSTRTRVGLGPPPSACIRRAVCGDAGCGSRPAGGHRRGRGRGFTTARRGVSRAVRRSPGGVRTLALGDRPCAGPPGLARRRAVAADSRCGGSREGRARRSGPGVQLLWLNALHSSSPGTPKPHRGAASDQNPASSTRCLANYRTVAQRQRPERERAPLRHRRTTRRENATISPRTYPVTAGRSPGGVRTLALGGIPVHRSARLSPKTGGRGGQLMRGE